MKIALIIQARMGSTRLQGKVMMPILGKPLLEHLIERVRHVKEGDIVVATTTNPLDDPIEDLCLSRGVKVFRGSENDVLSRYAAASRDCDVVVRLTSDCPLLDPDLIDLMLSHFLSGQVDYVSNTILRTYPRGYDVEIMSKEALEKVNRLAKTPSEREHVTLYIRKHQDQFSISQVERKPDISHLRLTVDTREDFELVTRIFESLPEGFRLSDVERLLQDNPLLLDINQNIKQKEVPGESTI